MRKILLLLMAVFMLAGCPSTDKDMGVVARVNGKPIALADLQFKHDMSQIDGGGAAVPTVNKLRGEYGSILGGLIVQELINQELARLDMSVTDAELAKAEADVRADYPEGAFEQVLIEEYIDLNSWRKQLRNHLAAQKFYSKVLRPSIKIDYKEAEAYYKDHITEFYMPASLKLLVLRSPNKAIVKQAAERYRTDGTAMDLDKKFTDLTVREILVRESYLSDSWRKELDKLQPGQAGAVLSGKFGFEVLVLIERSKAKVLSPTQAYPLVEEALLDIKLGEAFNKWLDGQLKTASIKVSEHLLKKAEADAAAKSANATAKE